MKNNNQKVIKKLSQRTMKQSRMRNFFAVAAICLTTLLFTAVFHGLWHDANDTGADHAGGRGKISCRVKGRHHGTV